MRVFGHCEIFLGLYRPKRFLTCCHLGGYSEGWYIFYEFVNILLRQLDLHSEIVERHVFRNISLKSAFILPLGFPKDLVSGIPVLEILTLWGIYGHLIVAL